MKVIKRIIILLMIILITFITTTVFAADKGKAIKEAKLKKSMDDSSITHEIIPKNDEFEILEDQGEWYKVNYMRIKGYVRKEYVEVIEKEDEQEKENTIDEEQSGENAISQEQITENQTSQEQLSQENNIEQEEIQIGENAYTKIESNVMVRPLINSIKLQTIPVNQEVMVIEIANSWVYVTTNSVSGWVRKDNLNVSKTQEEQPEEPKEEKEESKQEQPTINKTGYITSDGINFRKEPNTDCEVLKTFLLNAKVTILKEEGKWYKVKHKDQEGYVLKMYVSEKQTEVTSRGGETRPITTPVQETSKEETQENSTTSESNSSKASKAVELAKEYLGSRYVYGGANPSGFDCSRINYVHL